MTLIVVLFVIAVAALWLRQLWFERNIKDKVRRVEEDSGPTYYK